MKYEEKIRVKYTGLEKTTLDRSPISEVWLVLSRDERKQSLSILILLLCGAVLEVFGIGLLIPAVSLIIGVSDGDTLPYIGRVFAGRSEVWSIAVVVGALTLVQFLKSAFLNWSIWFQRGFSQKVESRLSAQILRYQLSRPYVEHLQGNSAVSIRDVTSAGQFVSLSVDSLLTLGTDGVVLVSLLGLLVIVEPVATIGVVLLCMLAIMVFHLLTRTRIARWGERRAQLEARRLQYLQEGFAALKEIKLYKCEELFKDRYTQEVSSITTISRAFATLGAMPRIWLEFLAFASLATLILSISFSGDSIASSIPTLAVFTAVAFRVIPTINRVVFAVQNLNFGKEVSKIIIGQVTSSPSIGPSRIPSLSDSDSILKAENIRFAYPNGGREVVSGVSLSIQPGEIVGITGENGSGKSTLVNLLLGLLEPDSGRILIKSSLVNEGKSPESRLIGYVPQSVYLIDNSLKSNIAFGLPLEAVDEKALLDAIRFSCLVDLVESLPEGINTSVGEGGVRLSGGQRQRVGLARAIYGSPALLILDEFTSSLDVDAEGEILSELSLRREALSIVMIAHSERALSICDRVFEMRDGQLYTSKTLRAR